MTTRPGHRHPGPPRRLGTEEQSPAAPLRVATRERLQAELGAALGQDRLDRAVGELVGQREHRGSTLAHLLDQGRVGVDAAR